MPAAQHLGSGGQREVAPYILRMGREVRDGSFAASAGVVPMSALTSKADIGLTGRPSIPETFEINEKPRRTGSPVKPGDDSFDCGGSLTRRQFLPKENGEKFAEL
jgi:hypothetical protein